MEGRSITADECQRLFEAPEIPVGELAGMSAAALLDFVKYVFERAGYATEYAAIAQSRDLLLIDGGKKRAAFVQTANYGPDASVSVDVVKNIEWKLGLPDWSSVPRGYLVTAGPGFTPPAKAAAALMPKLHLIEGSFLARYIRYVRGSRHEHAVGGPVSPEHLLDADSARSLLRSPGQTKVLALANNKGGVGKTTTALNIAFNLARRNNRVLLVDLDPQANLTQALPHAASAVPTSAHLADYFLRRHDMKANILPQLVRQTEFTDVWLIPSHADLRLADSNLHDWSWIELQFALDLHDPAVSIPTSENGRHFDWIILDTPPAMSLFTRAALAASHFVLAPAIPSTFADRGLERLLDTTDAVQALVGTGVHLLGCVVTHWDGKALMQDATKALETGMHSRRVRLFDVKIPYDQHIEQAHRETASGRKRSIFELARRPNPAAQKYDELVDEMLGYV